MAKEPSASDALSLLDKLESEFEAEMNMIEQQASSLVIPDDSDDEELDAALAEDFDLTLNETPYVDKSVESFLDAYASPELDFEAAKIQIEKGNVDMFKEAVATLQDINIAPCEEQNTLLHWAVSFGKPEMVRALIERKAFLLPNAMMQTPLDIALDIVKCAPGDSNSRKIVDQLVVRFKQQQALLQQLHNQ